MAPPSADLRAFAALADERDLTVLLPYQRGQSLDTLRGLEGRERLWPLVPSRQEDLKAMVAAAMEAGWGRAMVVEDPFALESTSSNTFVELFKAAGGIVESYEAQPVQRGGSQQQRASATVQGRHGLVLGAHRCGRRCSRRPSLPRAEG